MREYVQYVDWSFHAPNLVLAPDEVEAVVAGLRAVPVDYVNLVPETDPPLDSPCNF